MKKLLFVFALLAGMLTNPLHASVTFVQAPGACVSGPATTFTCKFAKPVTAGDTLVLSTMPLLTPGASAFGVAASDTVNGNWTPGVLCYTPYDAQASFFYLPKTAAGSDTVTVTYTGLFNPVELYISVAEYSGVNTSSPFDVAPTCSAFESSTTFRGPGLTTTQNGDLLISTMAIGNGGTTRVSSPYGMRVSTDVTIGDVQSGNAGPHSGPTWTTQYNNDGFVIDAALRAAIAGGGTETIGAVSGSGQSAVVGTAFGNPLVVIVKNADGSPLSGATVSFAGSGVNFPSGATATTGSNGEAQITAQPTATGALTVTASVVGVGIPATFAETGTSAGGSSGSITFVQAPASCDSNGGTNSLTCSFAKPVTAGDTLILSTMPLLTPGTSAFGVSVSDTVNGQWNPGVLCYTPYDAQASFFYVANTAGGSDTVTVTYSNMYQSAKLYMSLAEYSGVNVSSPFDVAPTCSAFEPSHPFEGPNLTTTQSNDLLLSALIVSNGGTTSVTSPYTVRVPYLLAIADNAPGTAGPQAGPTWSTQYNQDGFVVEAALRAGSAPSGTASISAVSGSGQTAAVGSGFANPLVVIVKDANSNPVAGATVTFSGSGVAFPSGNTATTGSNGEADVTAQPTATGSLTITARASGISAATTFSETGTAAAPASIAAVSGSGQSAAVGSSFANPLVVIVKDANSNPVSGATVTFGGSGVAFPSGSIATTGSNGEAQVTAQPTATGTLTVTASVVGVGAPATFAETGTSAGGTSGSITFVQAPASCDSNGSTNSLTCSFAKPVAAGDTLILSTMPLLTPGTSPFGVSVSDTINGRWAQGALCYTPYDAQASFFYVANTAAGSDTVTVTYSNMYRSAKLYMSLAEYSGVNAASPFDVAPTCSAFEPRHPFQGPTLTTTQANDLLVSALIISNGGTTSVTSPYTIRVRNLLTIADDTPGTAGPQTGPKWSTQYNQDGFVIGVALRAASQ